MRSLLSLSALLVAVMPSSAAAQSFWYAGVSLGTTLAHIKASYPNSKIVGGQIRVPEQESRDHVYGIQLAGERKPRTVRLSFERPRAAASGRPAYPPCKAIEAELRPRFGAPAEIRKAIEERPPRADRVWKNDREVMTLVCSQSERGGLIAEGIVIAER